MKFFIISLCINLILLAIPLKGFTIKPIKQDSAKVVLNEIQPKQEETTNLQEVEEVKEEKQDEIKEEKPKEVKKETKKAKKEVKKPVKKVKKQTKKQSSQQTNSQKTSNENTNNKDLNKPKFNNNDADLIDDNFCKANVVIEEIDNTYPKKAKMLRKLGVFNVSVRFMVTDSGINILNINGDKLFVEHTKKLFKNLKFKIKNKKAKQCVFIKTIEYKLS